MPGCHQLSKPCFLCVEMDEGSKQCGLRPGNTRGAVNWCLSCDEIKRLDICCLSCGIQIGKHVANAMCWGHDSAVWRKVCACPEEL